MNQDVKALEEAADAYDAFVAAGYPVDDPYDIYPPEVWRDTATTDRIRRLLDYIRKLEQEVANGK